jgi:protein-ribulosamine 3-kinase
MNPVSSYVERVLNKRVVSIAALGGGSIATAMKATLSDGETVFVKTSPQHKEMFAKEADGLRELARSGAVKTPAVLYADETLLILEFLAVSSPPNRRIFFEDFGRRFAALHRATSSSFGFCEDNFIGSTPQQNLPRSESWREFYYTRRLEYQITLAERNGYSNAELRGMFHALGRRMDELIPEDGEPPALLHGDLWAGNFLCLEGGMPAIIDPAVYYGHREADLAMPLLFGGFGDSFYASYAESFPLNEGWQRRVELYKLYHLLNHLNLFGEGYYSQVFGTMRDLIR